MLRYTPTVAPMTFDVRIIPHTIQCCSNVMFTFKWKVVFPTSGSDCLINFQISLRHPYIQDLF